MPATSGERRKSLHSASFANPALDANKMSDTCAPDSVTYALSLLLLATAEQQTSQSLALHSFGLLVTQTLKRSRDVTVGACTRPHQLEIPRWALGAKGYKF